MHITRLLFRFRNLQSLSLSGFTYLSDSDLTAFQHYTSNLQALHFDCCSNITDDGFSLVATACPSLALISLYRCNITNVGLVNLAKACSGLKQVNLSYCSHVSDYGLRALSQECRQLQAVRLSFCGTITGVGFAGCSPTLAYVEAVSCYNLSPKGLNATVSGGGIEYLDISITSLNWNVSTGLASGLKILNLRLCRSVGDESVIAISKGCPLLQEWNLSACSEVKLRGWISIGVNCNNLEKLHVSRCRSLCDRGLMALQHGCGRLSVLYMTGCVNVTSMAIEMFKYCRSSVRIKEEDIACIGPTLGFR